MTADKCTVHRSVFLTPLVEFAAEQKAIPCPVCRGIVDGVKAHARDHYNDGDGWDEVIECWDDVNILEVVVLHDCHDLTATLKEIGFGCKLRKERENEIRAFGDGGDGGGIIF